MHLFRWALLSGLCHTVDSLIAADLKALQTTPNLNLEKMTLWEEKCLENINKVEFVAFLPTVRDIKVNYGGHVITIEQVASNEKAIGYHGWAYVIPQAVLAGVLNGTSYIYVCIEL